MPASAENVTEPDIEGQALSTLVPKDTPLWHYICWGAAAHGLPAVYHVAVGVVLCLHELARKGIRLKTRRKIPLGFFFMFLGDSASGKTTAIDYGEDFIHDVWEDLGLYFDPDPWIELEGTIPGVLFALHDFFEPSRGTTVAIAKHHEAAALFQSGDTLSEMICRLADGATYQRNVRDLQKQGGRRRDPQGPDRIERPVLSALLAVTEASLAPHFKEAHRSGGLFSRFWWIAPKFSRKNIRIENEGPEVEAMRARAVSAWSEWLAKLDVYYSDPESKAISFSSEGEARFHEAIWEPMRAEFEDENDLNPVRLRAVDKARVLALLFATLRGAPCIGAEDVDLAVGWYELLLGHARRVGYVGSPELVRRVKRAERLIKSNADAGCNRRDLYQALRIDKRTLDNVLETLIDSGLVLEDPYQATALRYVHASTARAAQLEEMRALEIGRTEVTSN